MYAAQKLVREHGLTCLTLHAATLPVKDAVEVHRAVYYGKISADFAYKLGASVMVVHSNVFRRLPHDQRNLLLARIFKEIKPYAESLNLTLALENLSYASMGFGKNVAEMDEVFSVIDGGEIAVTLDFCHATATGVTQSLLETYHKRLCNVHMSNRAHKPCLEETSQLKDFITKLSKYRYTGPVTLELNRKCTLAEISSTKAVLEAVMRVC
ncbi:MAG: sugar phosphate isomerase/epimerase [Candidatus Bathyarchaeota archaeon]|nr:sugar phosphate isomerase/epimerase [Candidatus Bathyarchaeota archaeon]